MSSQQELQLNLKDRNHGICEQQSDANPWVAKSNPLPRYDPGLTKSIRDSSDKVLLNDLKESAEELVGDTEIFDKGKCTVTGDSLGLPTRLVLPKKAACVPTFGSLEKHAPNSSSGDGYTSRLNTTRDSVRQGARSRVGTLWSDNSEPKKSTFEPKFGSWEEHAPNSSSGHGYTSRFNKFRQSKPTGNETSRGDDAEPKKTTYLPEFGHWNETFDYAYNSSMVFDKARGNRIYFDNLWREGSEKDKSAPESIKQPE